LRIIATCPTLNASVLTYLVDARISTGMIWQTYPVFRLILLLIAGTWLIRFLVKRVYGKIRKAEVPVLPERKDLLVPGLFLINGPCHLRKDRPISSPVE